MPGAMIAGVIPLAFLTAGLVALAAGAVVLRSFGPRYRIGRLLATAPRVTVAEAVQLADAGPRYVAVEGRIDAEEPFEDDAHRPLVFRRTRLEQRMGSSGWTAFEDHREAVAFTVREGLDEIGIDTDALDSGLIVVRREAVGTAADVHERAGDLPPDTAVRLRIEQVSAVEHAIAVGVPRRDTDGGAVRLTEGLGRPLIVTTLERAEAMRILADGRTTRSLLAAICLAAGLGLVSIGFATAIIGVVL
jgi:hypothetical protein